MSAEPLSMEKALERQHARSAPPKRMPDLGLLKREFRALGEDRYRLDVPEMAVSIEIDRLRREHNELLGELAVSCGIPGAYTFDGSLSVADFNVSSVRARQDRAKLLAARSNAPQFDWLSLIEEFCQRLLRAEREGQPAVDLRLVARPSAVEETIDIDGLILPQRHPSMIFGDGGTVKSYTSLYAAGRMAQNGSRVGYFDWELAAEEHRDRLERLFPDHMPKIFYARCDRPLVYEADRLRRIARENELDYAIFDSVAFACDGPPESAEIAGKYFRAVRQIGVGSLHIAHITKGENADKRPFGSAFWHNGARSTWFAQLSEATREESALQIGLFNRKSNLGKLRAPVGFSIVFSERQTCFRRADLADNHELVLQLSVRQRMAAALGKGSLSPEQIADEIQADVETVRRTQRRYKNLFTVIEGGRIGLLEKRSS